MIKDIVKLIERKKRLEKRIERSLNKLGRNIEGQVLPYNVYSSFCDFVGEGWGIKIGKYSYYVRELEILDPNESVQIIEKVLKGPGSPLVKVINYKEGEVK